MNEMKMININKIMVCGRVTKDIEIKKYKDKKVANFRIAINRYSKDKNGLDWKTDVTYINCTAWNYLADTLEKSPQKGTPVYLEGKLVQASYTDKNGIEKSVLKIAVDQLQLMWKVPQQNVSYSQDFGEGEIPPDYLDAEETDRDEIPPDPPKNTEEIDNEEIPF